MSNGPSSLGKTELIKGLEQAYGEFNSKKELHSSPEEIKTHLMNHIATINPKLAQQIAQSPTEENVLRIIGKVGVIANTKASNDEYFMLSATA